MSRGFVVRILATTVLIGMATAHYNVTASGLTHDRTTLPGHVVTSTGRDVSLDPHGCFPLHKRETDLGMALWFCAEERTR